MITIGCNDAAKPSGPQSLIHLLAYKKVCIVNNTAHKNHEKGDVN